MNTAEKTRKLTIAAAAASLVFLATRLIQIPIPLGYANPGSAIIYLTSVFMGPAVGGAAGAIGSALSDLTSYPVWTIPTLVIRGLMGILPGLFARKWGGAGMIIGLAAAAVVSVAGYTVCGMIIYGSVATGITQIPGLALEQVFNLAIYPALYYLMKKTGIFHPVHA